VPAALEPALLPVPAVVPAEPPPLLPAPALLPVPPVLPVPDPPEPVEPPSVSPTWPGPQPKASRATTAQAPDILKKRRGVRCMKLSFEKRREGKDQKN